MHTKIINVFVYIITNMEIKKWLNSFNGIFIFITIIIIKITVTKSLRDGTNELSNRVRWIYDQHYNGENVHGKVLFHS